MNKSICIFIVLFLFTLLLNIDAKADTDPKTIFSEDKILNLADKYIQQTNFPGNPVYVDEDNDGDFDILYFNKEGRVEYYKNIGTLNEPDFKLENRNYSEYEIHSIVDIIIPVPLFFADRDGDGDMDLFAISKDNPEESNNFQSYKATSIENTLDLDHYTLITIILVLIAVILLIAILR
ncbi:MAG: VCBS repeat-containing protein [Bacteroidetes bacterium]|nr:VCBS repeat-containing protein [Bacteroidota bacterium]